MQTLTIGQTYPLKINEGAAADFMVSNTNRLIIGLPGLQADEVRSYRKDPIRAGVISDGSWASVVFQIGKKSFSSVLICPFDAAAIPEQAYTPPNLRSDIARMAVELHLVDTDNGRLCGLRVFTLAPKTSRDLLKIATAQRSSPRNPDELMKKEALYSQISETEIMKWCEMLPCG